MCRNDSCNEPDQGRSHLSVLDEHPGPHDDDIGQTSPHEGQHHPEENVNARRLRPRRGWDHGPFTRPGRLRVSHWWNSIVEAILSTRLESLVGRLRLTTPVLPMGGAPEAMSHQP